MGSGDDSWMVRVLGSAVRDPVGDSDWSKCLYSSTVPSAKPMARKDSAEESAKQET
jgi:hypothetical protein